MAVSVHSSVHPGCSTGHSGELGWWSSYSHYSADFPTMVDEKHESDCGVLITLSNGWDPPPIREFPRNHEFHPFIFFLWTVFRCFAEVSVVIKNVSQMMTIVIPVWRDKNRGEIISLPEVNVSASGRKERNDVQSYPCLNGLWGSPWTISEIALSDWIVILFVDWLDDM